MNRLLEVKDVDRRFWEERLAGLLPERLIDIHTHVWDRPYGVKKASRVGRVVTWPHRVAACNPYADLKATYSAMFPDRSVTPLIFGMTLERNDDFDEGNGYVAACSRQERVPALLFARPDWNAEEFEARIVSGGFLGAKVYLSLAEPDIPLDKIGIFDFLPFHQLEVLNEHGWIAMLHIPRDGRLRDSMNLRQMMEIDRRFPRIKLIIAHVGRAYCAEDLGHAFKLLKNSEHMLFDISANTNQKVFEELIRSIGPARILFGSDLPVVRMRMRRVCEGGLYVNLVPKGLYGDVSTDKHMREVEGAEAEEITFFLYEEIDAFQRAAAATGLSTRDVENVFYNNSHRILREAGAPASWFSGNR